MRTFVLLSALGAMFGVGWAQRPPAAPALQVIVNADNPVETLRRDELARLFLKKTIRWPNGTLAETVDQPLHSPLRAAFDQRVLGMSDPSVESYWRDQVAKGHSVPAVEPTDGDAIAHVRTSTQAVAYVSADAQPGPGVKVVTLTN